MSQIFGNMFGSERPEPPRLTPFDYLTRLIVPVIALLALIVAQLHDQRAVMWVLIVIASLSLIASFYPLVVEWLNRWLDARRDRRIARREFPRLREFVERFEGFVAPNRGDALHGALLDAFNRNSEIINKFGIPPAQLFRGFWLELNQRAMKQRPTVENFEAIASEFGALVSQYNDYCVQVVFNQVPRDVENQLSDKEGFKRRLNASREAFNEFLSAYESFLEGLGRPFLERHVKIRNFPRARPL
jgi:hypothetical protein